MVVGAPELERRPEGYTRRDRGLPALWASDPGGSGSPPLAPDPGSRWPWVVLAGAGLVRMVAAWSPPAEER